MRILFAFILFCFTCSCKQNKATKDDEGFKFPVVIQDIGKDSLWNFKAESIQYSRLRVALKSALCDTVKISSSNYMDTSIGKNFRETVDRFLNNDSVGNDGLEIYCDYKKNIYKPSWDEKIYNHYPVYLFNGTKSNKAIPLKDQDAFGIQEALDSNGRWYPIEGQGFDFCGNGSWTATLKPKEFLMLLVPKYKGNYTTKLRMRIKVGASIYVSQPYEGKINYSQFYISEDSYFLNHIKEDRTSLSYFFYGSTPLSLEGKKLPEYAVYAF